MGLLYVGQDGSVRIWTDSIWVSIGVCGNGLAVSMSGLVCENMGWPYLGQDSGMRIWACCI
jgi:hypothetical protein